MRTTLTLDDDLAGLLKQRAHELGIPFNSRKPSIERFAPAWARPPRLGAVPHRRRSRILSDFGRA